MATLHPSKTMLERTHGRLGLRQVVLGESKGGALCGVDAARKQGNSVLGCVNESDLGGEHVRPLLSQVTVSVSIVGGRAVCGLGGAQGGSEFTPAHGVALLLSCPGERPCLTWVFCEWFTLWESCECQARMGRQGLLFFLKGREMPPTSAPLSPCI